MLALIGLEYLGSTASRRCVLGILKPEIGAMPPDQPGRLSERTVLDIVS
jgi:hypothetical protein